MVVSLKGWFNQPLTSRHPGVGNRQIKTQAERLFPPFNYIYFFHTIACL